VIIKLRCLVLATLLAGGCGNSGTSPSAPATDRRNTAASSTTSTDVGGVFSTDSVRASGTGQGLLARVTATSAGELDAVTFEFESAVPGYDVSYADGPLVEDGSGKPVVIDGDAVLLVRFEPASGYDLSGDGRQVFKGPTRLDLATTTVTDVVRVGDFEAVLQWAIGVNKKVPFRVHRGASSHELVVEVRP